MARAYAELTAGYTVDPERLVNGAIFTVDYDEMVVVRDIDFYSLCEHHLLPFYGRAHVAYIPQGQVIGLSKIPRVVEMFARRLQVQERMTVEIADFVEQVIDPRGRGRGRRGHPHVLGDAGRAQGELAHGDQRHAGRLPRRRQDPLASSSASSTGAMNP